MEKIIDENKWGDPHVFEIIDEFPNGYTVWNIGRWNFPHIGYIPLCMSDKNCHVNLKTLKALKVASEDFALFLLKEGGKRSITKRRYLNMVTNWMESNKD